MSECEAYRMAPCPFCGSEIRHVESWARSFDPPRLYHEWHHIEDNPKCWVVHNRGKMVGSASDDPETHQLALDRWNHRDRYT